MARRRVTGLRREEVAAAAGISVDYYTRLEQGREANPSDSVLRALARALVLEPDAVDHLYQLRGSHPLAPHHVQYDDMVVRMSALVSAVRPNPAYILDRLSNIVMANPEGLAMFDGLSDIGSNRPNTCRYLLTHPRAREIFLDWEELARGAVANLRAANADHLDDPRLKELVAELRRESHHFDEWWNGHVVERRRASVERIRAEDGSIRTRRYEVLHLPEERLRMTIWLPT